MPLWKVLPLPSLRDLVTNQGHLLPDGWPTLTGDGKYRTVLWLTAWRGLWLTMGPKRGLWLTGGGGQFRRPPSDNQS